MKVKEKKWIRFRIYLIATFFLLGLVTVLSRAYQLQVIEKSRLEAIARDGYVRTIKLPPKRGTISDREGHELALSVEVGSVYAHPTRIKDKFRTARELSSVLGEETDSILALLKSGRSFLWIKRRIDPDRAEKVKNLELDGVGLTTEIKRYYPGKEIAAHLIGFVGSDNQGLEGLEKKYEKVLRGPQFSLIQMRDALGRPFSVSRLIPSGHGMRGLILTIDKDIQYKAQQVLKAAVKKTRARSGHCLVMDPDTGEILAIAVVPEFNPNAFSSHSPGEWRNRTVTDCFEPGSVVKAFLLAACLEEGVVTPETEFDCEQGEYKVGRHVIHDTHEQGVLSAADIIIHSSNIGAIKIGQKLGYERFYEYLKKFGFGNRLSSDLLGEREGFIRPPSKAKEIEQSTIFFGQGMTVTSLQLITAMASIANGGKLMRPYIVKAIVDESGKVVEDIQPRVIRRILRYEVARKTSTILEGVVGEEEGTGKLAAIKGFRVAGKTGTAQKVDPKTLKYSTTGFTAAFLGFTPVDKPRLVILVVIDEPKGSTYGGVVAGPVFREVGAWSLNYLRINPQTEVAASSSEARKDIDEDVLEIAAMIKKEDVVIDPEDERNSETSSVEIEKGVLPDFRGLGMRQVVKKGRSLGLQVVMQGSGLAVKQEPSAGCPLKGLNSVRVDFKPPS